MTDKNASLRQEDRVNKRAGHIAVGHKDRAIVWGGYLENQVDNDQYWNSSEVMVYNSLTQTWVCQRTTGDVPSKCSGAAATVLGDAMYVVAGFHKVVISYKEFREGNEDIHPWLESDSDTEDDEANSMVSSVEISNNIWSLDLLTWVWTKLNPGGEPPLKCDKTACWTYKDKVYVFGGFGPPPSTSQMDKKCSLYEFTEDPSTNVGYIRGWSNQLVCYNTSTNKWEWPVTMGPVPSPRAAHSVAIVGDMAYVFGGRHLNTRLNDLYSLNLTTMRWSIMISNIDNTENIPVGRSWQTMTPVVTGKEEGGLVIYGGFDTSETALGDCWRMDLASQPSSWIRCPHLEQGPRLWHASLELDSSLVMVVGGLTNNILAASYISKNHAEKVLFLKVAPSSLLKMCLEYVSKHKDLFKQEVEDLPFSLKKIVQIRCSSGA